RTGRPGRRAVFLVSRRRDYPASLTDRPDPALIGVREAAYAGSRAETIERRLRRFILTDIGQSVQRSGTIGSDTACGRRGKGTRARAGDIRSRTGPTRPRPKGLGRAPAPALAHPSGRPRPWAAAPRDGSLPQPGSFSWPAASVPASPPAE